MGMCRCEDNSFASIQKVFDIELSATLVEDP